MNLIKEIFSRTNATWILSVLAIASVALGFLGAEKSIDLMKYYAAITTVGVAAACSLIAVFIGKNIPAKILHLGFAFVLAGWVYSQLTSPTGGAMQLCAEMKNSYSLPDDDTRFTLDSFAIDYWENSKAIKQYTSKVSLSNGQKATISVNHPFIFNGWWIYQNSYKRIPHPHTGEYFYFTILQCIKDTGLPFVALGGGLILLGAALWMMTFINFIKFKIKPFNITRPLLHKITVALYFFTFLCTVAMLIHRTVATGHPPMQNMYEFLMCTTSFIPLLTFASAFRDKENTLLVDAALQTLILIPIAFFMNGDVRKLMPALQSPLFIPHVGAYVIGYVILVRAALGAGRRLVGAGFFLLTLGLVLGALWGKICWGNWWQFDPKEMWSLAPWLVYASFFHVAPRLSEKQKTAFLALGAIMIILTLTWINLSRIFTGMHSYA
jgi:ABC-type transport system involved in cytochrome c biogenesis permease subunit